MANTTITPTVGAATLAGVAPTLAQLVGIAASGQSSVSGQGYLATWAGLNFTTLTTGAPESIGAFSEAYFEATGTIGAGGSVQIEGSNDGVNWVKLSPAAVTSLPGVFLLAVNELPLFVRPHVTAGDGTTNITVTGWFKV